MSKKGIDVSKHNGTVNWQAIKNAGYGDFALLRLGLGSDYENQDDPQFERNISECERLGIPYGVYIYSYALNTNDALSEVKHALRQLKKVGNNFKYGVWFDMEDADGYKNKHGMPSNSTLVDICYTFCENIERAGYHTGIYASLSWLNNQLNDSKLDRFDKWVAQWNDTGCTYGKSYSIWQNTSNLVLNGKRFDGNILVRDFNGSQKNNSTVKTANCTGDITYKTYDNAKKCYLPSVVNDSDYAGNKGHAIGGIKAMCKNGNLYIQAHVIGKQNWENTVTLNASNYNSSAGSAYAGILGKNIDMVKVWSDYGYVEFRVSPMGGNYYGWVNSKNRNSGGPNSYAGVAGKAIDRIQMR